MNRSRSLVSLAVVLVLVAIAVSTISLPITYSFKIWYYAKELVYPNPGIPEPVLAGAKLELRFKYPKESLITVKSARIYNEISICSLTYVKTEWNEEYKTINVYLSVPKNCREGLYTLELKLVVNGATKTIVQPNSVWVLKKWPDKIKLLYVADTKTPAGEPYWKRMAMLINVLNPTLMIFGGDEVDRPTYRSAWVKFLKWWLQLRIPAYAGIGNHEYDAPGIAKTWEKFFGYRYYAITVGKFLFILLDTGMEGWVDDEQLDWLEKVLKENPDKMKILYMHHPIFSLKWKDEKRWYMKIEDIDKAFKYMLGAGYIYPSMADHPEQTKRLLKLILENDVRLVLSGHIHQDLNVMLEYKGKKFYFITVAGVPFDVPKKVPRGFRLIEIYANGTIDEKTLTYAGKGFADYPTDIPIDSGEGVIPYKLGLIEFYYTPKNDGSRKAVSFRIYNPLDQEFRDIYIAFRISKEVPIDEYSIVPKAEYEVYELKDYYLVVLKHVDLPPRSVVKFTIYAVPDKEPPKIVDVKLGVEAPIVGKVEGYVIGYVKVFDDGWGVDSVDILYKAGGKWKKPVLIDLDEDATMDGYVAYYFWIPSKDIAEATELRIVVKDFANNSVEKVFSIKELLKATPTLTPTTKPTTPTPTAVVTVAVPKTTITVYTTKYITTFKPVEIYRTVTSTIYATQAIEIPIFTTSTSTITIEKVRNDIALTIIAIVGAIVSITIAFMLRRTH